MDMPCEDYVLVDPSGEIWFGPFSLEKAQRKLEESAHVCECGCGRSWSLFEIKALSSGRS